MALPVGIMLAASVGAMTQLVNILSVYPDFYEKYGTIAMLLVAVVACVGSYLIGIFDTKFGTKKAILLSCALMVLGILGLIPTSGTLFAGLLVLCLFEGSSSNFAVSMVAQYWKREDFGNVYGYEPCDQYCPGRRTCHHRNDRYGFRVSLYFRCDRSYGCDCADPYNPDPSKTGNESG